MKKIYLITSILFLTKILSYAQNPSLTAQGGEVVMPQNTAPCITDIQRENLKLTTLENIAKLKSEGKLQNKNITGGHPLFNWPVAQANGFEYNSVWVVSNYIDHNLAYPNQILDYDCGTKSYDTNSGYNHQGFDIVTWPFWWKQMELDQAINIAAADGQIVNKLDGAFDRNCAFNNGNLNAVVLQHDDGSITWYLHMKEGSLGSNIKLGDKC